MTAGPELVVLIGPAGAGKSTYAAARYRPSQVVGLDQLREVVADDDCDQDATTDAVGLLLTIVDMRLARRLTTVIDATNGVADERAHLLALAAHHQVPATAVVFTVDVEVCLDRQTRRPGPLPGRRWGRAVPESVVRNQHQRTIDSVATRGGQLPPPAAADPGLRLGRDTHGATLANFALFDLVGKQLSPRIRDLGKITLYRTGPRADFLDRYPRAGALLTRRLNLDLITSMWDDLLRVAASVQGGHATAALVVGKLCSSKRQQNALTNAIKEYRALRRTLYATRYLADETYRRRIARQLNKGENLRQTWARARRHQGAGAR